MVEFNVNKNTITANVGEYGYVVDEPKITEYSNATSSNSSSLYLQDEFKKTMHVATIATTHKNEPEKTFKTKEILDLWDTRVKHSITKEYEDKIDNLFASDTRVLQLSDHLNAIRELFSDSNDVVINMTEADLIGIGKECYLTKNNRVKYDKIMSEYKAAEATHYELFMEIKTLLMACGGMYIEELNILKAYNIVDKSGKLIKIK